MKHIGQELGGELCKIFKFWLFLQSQFVKRVCKLLQLQTIFQDFGLRFH